MATTGPQEGESEGVIVDTDTKGAVILELDDGRVLCFDRAEIVHAIVWARHQTERQRFDAEHKYPTSMHDGSETFLPPEGFPNVADRDKAA